jgi:hypothetical protein
MLLDAAIALRAYRLFQEHAAQEVPSTQLDIARYLVGRSFLNNIRRLLMEKTDQVLDKGETQLGETTYWWDETGIYVEGVNALGTIGRLAFWTEEGRPPQGVGFAGEGEWSVLADDLLGILPEDEQRYVGYWGEQYHAREVERYGQT